MDAFEIKRIIARYLRYDIQCPILGLECSSMLNTSYNDGGAADLIAVDKNRYIIEVEVKISIADMKADRRKEKHEYYRKCMGLPYKNTRKRFNQIVVIEPHTYPTHKFYFAVPWDIGNEAQLLCEDQYPYAGLLTNEKHHYGNVTQRRPATILNKEKSSLLNLTKLAKSQSATIVRLMDEISGLKTE